MLTRNNMTLRGTLTKIKSKLKRVIYKKNSGRFIEIDIFRGLALFLMIVAHIVWDLDYFKIIPLNNNIYSTFSKVIPILFFLIVGISLIVSKKKIENKTIGEQNRYYKNLIVRGLKIIGFGMILTIGSFIFIPDKPVFFGVLHCIGLSIIISVPILKYKNYAFLYSILFIFLSLVVTRFTVEKPNFLQFIVGIHQTDVMKYTVDYFPLLPWLTIIIIGIAVGDLLYCGDKRTFKLPDLSRYKSLKIFQWIGQHSLGIYLIHQPIIGGLIAFIILI
jgi:uncharacterized membrane protein